MTPEQKQLIREKWSSSEIGLVIEQIIGESTRERIVNFWLNEIDLAIKQTEERIVEKIEVWQPVESGGEAIREDGTHMKRIAILLDGTPLFLEKNFYIEKQGLSKEESKVLQDNFTLIRNK